MNILISLVQTKILQFFIKIIILVWKCSHAYNRAYDWVNSEALFKCQNRMNELKDLTSKNRTIYAYRYNFTTVQKNHFRPFEKSKIHFQMIKNRNHKWAKNAKSEILESFEENKYRTSKIEINTVFRSFLTPKEAIFVWKWPEFLRFWAKINQNTLNSKLKQFKANKIQSWS